MLILLTGEGKGKTTSAIGSAIRCVGSGQRASVFQFIKKTESSEIAILRQHMEVRVGGAGFTWAVSDDESRKTASETWQCAKVALLDASIFMVVLDELTYAVDLIDDDVQQVISGAKCKSIIITGRYPTEWMSEMSDIHSHIECLKYTDPSTSIRGIGW